MNSSVLGEFLLKYSLDREWINKKKKKLSMANMLLLLFTIELCVFAMSFLEFQTSPSLSLLFVYIRRRWRRRRTESAQRSIDVWFFFSRFIDRSIEESISSTKRDYWYFITSPLIFIVRHHLGLDWLASLRKVERQRKSCVFLPVYLRAYLHDRYWYRLWSLSWWAARFHKKTARSHLYCAVLYTYLPVHLVVSPA